jgi:hypothetical protein
MIIIRLAFLILFLLIGILFTLGYNLFSIINFKNKLYNGEIFIDNMNLTNIETNETINYKYNDLDIDSNYKLILTYLYYGCIATSCLIGVGIIVSYLRMKFISKILFILSQTFMTTFVGIILFMYYSSSFVKNLIPYFQSISISEEYKDTTTSYGNGGILLLLSSTAMIVVYIIYSFIG